MHRFHKGFSKIFAASVLMLTFASPAFAGVDLDVSQAVRSVAGANSNVRVDVEGNTVILTGYVADSRALLAIEQAAEQNGMDTVINNVFSIGI